MSAVLAFCVDSRAAARPHGAAPQMTHSELAWEFAELFGDLETSDLNKVVANNVPMETLEFFADYAESFAKSEGIESDTRRRLPNLLLLGYLLRVLEDRLLDGPDDA